MDKPFFFAVGYVKPHMPFNAPKTYWDLYDRLKLPMTQYTIIVVWSDHGWKLGDYRGWGKMTNYELDTRSPMFIIDPRFKDQAGTSRKQLVESLDLFPTLCELTETQFETTNISGDEKFKETPLRL